jgi:hypothetical protein
MVGSGKPSVNVDGHGTFSGSAVVVVPSVDCDEVPLRRGILEFGKRRITKEKKSTKRKVTCVYERLLAEASVVLLIQSQTWCAPVVENKPMTSRVEFYIAMRNVEVSPTHKIDYPRNYLQCIWVF